ncbi:MAG: glycosyltransferase family 2 protein [Ruminococcaceae bacterium]|nr:glycosyltransferase family 2 protein [Oscillospiraceae bacterium]
MIKHKPPLISIVMPAYNAEKTIEESIQSVLSQTCDCWELIIINDASTDCTADLVCRYKKMDSRIVVLTNPINSGVSYSRKRGVDSASGNWIAFLDSDDLWTADKLEKQMELLKNDEADLFFTGSSFIKADGTPYSWIMQIPNRITYRQLLKQNIISNSSVLVRKELLQKHMVEGDHMHEDFACWLGCLRDGAVVQGINQPLLIYRVSATSKSGNKIKAAKMNWNTYRSVGLSAFESAYYMIWYCIRGIKKYRNLK